MNRRAFLKGAGAGVGLSVGGGGSWYLYDRGVFSIGEGPAYAPWRDWRDGNGEGPLALVRAAILAASPHNTQPWRFQVGDSFVELHIDRQRNVGDLDPYLREEYIGMGCALENLMLAAAANGFAATAAVMPGTLSSTGVEPQSEMVARVELASGRREESAMYQAIPRRHTNRSLYDRDKPVPADFVVALSGLAGEDEKVKLFLFTEEGARRKIVEISSAANTELYSDPHVESASERWIRLQGTDVQKFRDGLEVDAFGLSPIISAAAKALPTQMLSRLVSRGQKEGYAERMLAAPLIGFIAVRDRYDREQCVQAGRLWQRAHLFATARDVAARPGNEAMEMVDYQRRQGRPAQCLTRLSEITGDATWQPTFAFLMGYPTATAHASPRRGVQEVLGA